MLYTTDQMEGSFLDEAMSILEGANYLTEQESKYYPEMVPIRENQRLGKNLIRVEDFVEYSLANGIGDGAYAFGQICEASKVDPESVAFSVDETSILEDVEMEDTVRQLISAGAEVYAAPISKNDMAFIMAEAAVDISIMGIEQGAEDYTDALFEAFVLDDFDTFLSEELILEYTLAQPTLSGTFKDIGNNLHRKTIGAAVNKAKSGLKKGALIGGGLAIGGIAAKKAYDAGVFGKVETAMKQASVKPRAWIAKKISAFRSMLDRFSKKQEQITQVPQNEETKQAKGIINKIIDKIKQAIKYLSTQLNKAASSITSRFK